MNTLSWVAAVCAAGATWVLAPRYGLSILGQDVVILFCFFAGAAALYVVQLLKVILKLLVRSGD